MADSLLKTFSLSNILRQFFCGVVFFVPFFCISGTAQNTKVHSLNEWVQGGFFNQDWSTPKVAALCVLACIVGTIIYHLEKNAYSYFTQCLIIRLDSKSKFLWCVCSIAVILIALICFACTLSSWWLLYTLVFCISCWVALDGKIVTFTLQQWVAEQINERQGDLKTDALVSFVKGGLKQIPPAAIPKIAERIARWSDYIHCTQSCCLAYMAGFILGPLDAKDNTHIVIGIVIPVCLLVLEFVFDCHRYKFVRVLLCLGDDNVF